MTDGLLRVTKYSLRSLWWSGLGLTGVLVLPPLGFRYLKYLLEKSPDSQFVFSESHFAFLGISAYLFFILCQAELGHMQKLMSRMPVSTAAFASGLILSTLGIVVMVSLVSNGIYRLFLFDENWYRNFWPVTGPTLFLTTLIAVIHGVYWNLQAKGFARLLFWVSFGVGMLFWFLSRYYPHGFKGVIVPWTEVTLAEYFTMLIVFVAAWVVAIRSCARVRYGAAAPSRMWERVWQGFETLKHVNITADSREPDSVSSAFARLYWRDSCRSATLIFVLLGCVIFVASLFTGTGSSEVDLFAFLFLFGSSFYLSFGLGCSLSPRNSPQMKGYLAIVPLSDRDIAIILVRLILKLVFLSIAAIILFGLTGGSLISLLFQGTATDGYFWSLVKNDELRVRFIYINCLLLLAYWTIISNVIALFWAPQRGSTEMIFAVPVLVWIALIVKMIFSNNIGDVIFLSISALIWSITILAYVHAYRTGLIRTQAIWLAALFCLVVPAVYWDFWGAIELPLRVLLSSLLVLSVTPFATIPLAVSWSRHR